MNPPNCIPALGWNEYIESAGAEKDCNRLRRSGFQWTCGLGASWRLKNYPKGIIRDVDAICMTDREGRIGCVANEVVAINVI